MRPGGIFCGTRSGADWVFGLGRSLKTTRNRGKHCHFGTVVHGCLPLRWFPIDPHPGVGQHPGEVTSESFNRNIQNVTDSVARDFIPPGSSRFAGCGE